WRSDAVKEALDLCLACKGCKGDCPVHVDMATYKAEFLAHYYERRIRPIHAYAFGFIHNWARLASIAPSVANFFSQHPQFSGLIKRVVGIAPERHLPVFAKEPFMEWFGRREIHNRKGPRVVLWPDTFNNFFHPYIAQAAVDVLEDAGCRVIVPRQDMCCGRPLYDYGFLKTARKYLEDILHKMADEIIEGLPFIVLEPSCCAVFRDELTNLLPHNVNAQRLKEQTFTLAEFLTKRAPGYRAPILMKKAVLHGHCHHKSLLKMNADEELLRRMTVDFQKLDSGCCGMAGAFGFEKEHYDISIKCGERVLLPRARELRDGDLLITDGFSCHEQVLQQTGKGAVHLAQVLQAALRTGKREEPEKRRGEKQDGDGAGKFLPKQRDGHGRLRWIAPIGAAMAAAAIAYIAERKD
ncbi:MAG TPA: heterodisulfide reductase-related iron-sulfur binding cluster, partial [Verrucomicrobiae bacterium]|nr:heterodisulfide reductase-related iron-sulfur binding cluster [Verrucomicrobiae bacterium]